MVIILSLSFFHSNSPCSVRRFTLLQRSHLFSFQTQLDVLWSLMSIEIDWGLTDCSTQYVHMHFDPLGFHRVSY
jgi:hypothetical protein